LQTSDSGFWGLTRSQYTARIHVIGPCKINRDAASPQRVPWYSIHGLVWFVSLLVGLYGARIFFFSSWLLCRHTASPLICLFVCLFVCFFLRSYQRYTTAQNHFTCQLKTRQVDGLVHIPGLTQAAYRRILSHQIASRDPPRLAPQALFTAGTHTGGFGFGFGLLCRHTAGNSITAEMHTGGAQ